MFALKTFMAVAAATLPFATKAMQIISPTEWLANATVKIEWISVATDPEFFSIFLFNPVLLPTGPIGIADTIDAFLFEYDVPLTRVTPGDGYFFQFTNIGNITDVIATTGFFPIRQNDVDGSASANPSATAVSNSRAPGSATASLTGTATAPIRTPTTRSAASVPSVAATSNTAQPTELGGGSGSGRTASLGMVVPAVLMGAVGLVFSAL